MERLVGIDVARGLAVLGMFAAHVGYNAEVFWSPTGWLAVADGRSSAWFALLAGVSIALMSGGRPAAEGAARAAARQRIAIRAVAVAVLGYVLVSLSTPIAVILPSYALMFALALPFLGARPRTLLASAAAFALLGPLLVAAVGGRARGMGVDPLGLLLTGYYPVAVWMAYPLTGLALGRLSLRTTDTRVLLITGGAGLALLGYGFGLFGGWAAPELAPLLSIAPHADTTPEVLGNLGVAVALVGLVLVAADTRAGRLVLLPVAAVGSMALTVYTAQLVAIFVMGPAVVYEQTTNGTLLAFTAVTLVACTLWARLAGRGPLERALRILDGSGAPRSEPAGAAPHGEVRP